MDIEFINTKRIINPKSFGFTQVFSGDGCHKLTNKATTYKIPGCDLQVHHDYSLVDDYKHCIPLSTGMFFSLFSACFLKDLLNTTIFCIGSFDTRFHEVLINNKIITVICNAAGKCGTFTKRNQNSHKGFLSFLGERSCHSQAQPSPSEGPCEHGRWHH